MFEDSTTGQLLARYGYLAVLVGTMLEGETVVLVAGFFAHQGYLSLPWIIFCAVLGSTISDQGLFFLARLRGVRLLCRFPKVLSRVQELSDRARARPIMLTVFALLFRFFYGLRNVAPLFLGISNLPTLRFVGLNAMGAVVWATVFSSTGYFFAQALSAILGTLARYEVVLALVLVAGGSFFHFFYRLHRVRRRKKAPNAKATNVLPCPEPDPIRSSVQFGHTKRRAHQGPSAPHDNPAIPTNPTKSQIPQSDALPSETPASPAPGAEKNAPAAQPPSDPPQT